MNLNITGIHYDITDAVKNRVAVKLKRISRHAADITSIAITLSVDKIRNKAEADVYFAKKDLHIEAVESDMHAAIDVLMDKLDRAILKHKEKSSEVRS